ncbi:3-hydroxybutyrate dehydrogenase [Roseomonas sp. OT10]|uniref:3-hydroxybutyrate dehydrogenase n=1 Tax=Roseomonas cutis TaxID=2897332 RepID=UPI001E3141C7|nr:3-hydroxybutyrate dehydrogenase [Roseomonas sp. OT10]UFN50523.1 3-hydroxybutyrate dehydrogenase [Roseomonas sp. OT10]
MDKILEGRTALVTGSTSGIGLGIALAFARAGAKVMIHGLGEPGQIDHARAEIYKVLNEDAPYSPADLSDPREVRKMCGEAQKALGRVDILVNNAGIQFTSPVEEFPEEKWDAILAINLSSAFHATKVLLPPMKEAGWGRIINIASAHGLVASPFKAAYVAAKHGVVGLTKVVALETARTGVTCNAICPGFVRTPLAEKQVDAIMKEKGLDAEHALTDVLLERQPSKRWVEVEEVAQGALYLAGPHSGSVTGSSLSIDGAWTTA